jgi:S-formylglutathione hydrolase FrmB
MSAARVAILLTATSVASPAVARPPHCGALTGDSVVAGRPAQAARLCGTLRSPAGGPDGPGTLVLTWYSAAEATTFQGGRNPPMVLARALFDRARVHRYQHLDRAVPYALDYPGGPAVVLAIADIRHEFWATLFGEGAGNLMGLSPPATPDHAVDVALAPIPQPGPAPERCQGERFELLRVEAPEVAGTVGNDTSRRLCVRLPRSYQTSDRRYPVVYLLSGFASADTAYLKGQHALPPTADRLAAEGAGEVILVGVDTSTRHGSTYFTDSTAGGAWDRFARERMVSAVDGRYRTTRRRGLVGHSTGGFNAVSLAIHHPDLFGAVGASAPDALDLEGWLLDGNGRVRPHLLAWSRLEAAVGGAGQMISYAAAWAAQAPPSAIAFPFDLQTGVVQPAAWDPWRRNSPLRVLDDPERQRAIRSALDGRIFLTVGKGDEFGLTAPTQRFAARLDELGIRHELHTTAGGHGSDSQAGLESALAFVVRALAR